MATALTVLAAYCIGSVSFAIVVSRLMCSEAMPTLAEVEAMIAQQRKRE